MRTLIVYATKYGCTAKAVAMLEKELGQDVTSVNIMDEKVPELSNYDCVILGGSIYMGKIQKRISQYSVNNLSTLMSKKIGLFICAGSPNESDREKELVDAFPTSLYDHATCKKLFGYIIDYDKMKWLDRMIMRMVSKSKESLFKLNDEVIKKFAIEMKR